MKACSYEEMNGVYRTLFSDEVYNTIGCITGSYNVLLCRLFGLSYVDFLKFIVQKYNATLKGPQAKYVSFYFKNEKDVINFCIDVNKRWDRRNDN